MFLLSVFIIALLIVFIGLVFFRTLIIFEYRISFTYSLLHHDFFLRRKSVILSIQLRFNSFTLKFMISETQFMITFAKAIPRNSDNFDKVK